MHSMSRCGSCQQASGGHGLEVAASEASTVTHLDEWGVRRDDHVATGAECGGTARVRANIRLATINRAFTIILWND